MNGVSNGNTVWIFSSNFHKERQVYFPQMSMIINVCYSFNCAFNLQNKKKDKDK